MFRVLYIAAFAFVLTLGKDQVPLKTDLGVEALLGSLPKECSKNGKKFQEGETFEFGRLRYKCQKYGVYTIEGCKTEKGVELKRGETKLIDNILYQCLSVGSSVYFRETSCGIPGSPDCDKVPKPTGFEEALKNEQKNENKGISVVGLPEGWKVLNETSNKIPGTNATIVTKTLFFSGVPQRRRRQSGFGVGRVVGMESVGTDKPPMPMHMQMHNEEIHHGTHGGAMKNSHHTGHHPKNVVSTQTVGATLNTKNRRVVSKGTGDVDLHQRAPTRGNVKGFKPETVSGWRSDVKWNGKTIQVNGKTLAADAGTFTFGNRPTGGMHATSHHN